MTLEPAPAGQRVAYLRKVGSFAMAGTKVQAIIGVEAIDELVVYDLARGSQVVEICEACSVGAGSLRWSPSGSQLYFSARDRQGHGFDHRPYIYDAKSVAVVPLPTAGVSTKAQRVGKESVRT